MIHYRDIRGGLVLGGLAILLWSTSSVLMVWAGKLVGPWQFMVVVCGIGGLMQCVYYLRMGHSIRELLLPPPRLWLAAVLGFALYLPLITMAMTECTSKTQAVGVNLTNYLWPMLTVLCAVALVPGTRLTAALVVGIALSLAGLGLANYPVLKKWFSSLNGSADGASATPYMLAAAAALAWAIYSALVARWRAWANRYATAAVGFLAVSLISAVVCTARGLWRPMDGWTIAALILSGLGPQGAGYMLWEMALHRAPASTLGLMSAVIPALSTVWMLVFFAVTGNLSDADKAHPLVLLAAAGIIALSVLLGGYQKKPGPE
ncbi:MAG: DMT family transporter [Planctomycetes bacterium]|nr:DMT family transporter [Planctomycetota bacterium]